MGVNVMFDRNSSLVALASLLFVAVIVATPAKSQTFEPPPAKEGYSYTDPYCSNRGNRVEMGELSCLRVDGRVYLARCGMSLNSPVWREVQDICPPEFNILADKNAATLSSPQPGTN
jgi:hypothetical protein